MKLEPKDFIYNPWVYTIIGGLAVIAIWHYRGWFYRRIKRFIKKSTEEIITRTNKIVTSFKSPRKIPDFIATEQENSDQGCYGRRLEIPINRRLKKLSFIVESDDDFWRAGFKVFSPNGNFQPLADVKEGILFHLAYPHSERNKIKALTLTSKGNIHRNIEKKNKYSVDVFVNDKNFMTLLVNKEKCFGERINPANLENAYLGAWADYEPDNGQFFVGNVGFVKKVKKFKIKFSSITYI